ncbi:high mobility group B protein 9 isoform X3 [Amborella trichopoda]|uniref:high mobility group B protein 9 isoform X3 n=1 Tax=Amborella trichopoda TaxID=13333 RepID=UPI0005D3543F|nr:high mobility group B protein 9 isoform X3 [Amborella trichopoda]|eukprot:XP_011629069.1 high mobility group B protein 9 isoform X3 [Amborella trichopoda]
MSREGERLPEKSPGNGDGVIYPLPLAFHEDVVKNQAAFIETLRQFHSKMRTRFMIPVLGGKELDLHLLYTEVTNRGGLEKVIGDRKWKDVIAAFNFPPTTTSASFVLRKYYISLLHHYEQVYFFRTKGPLVPPAAPVNLPAPVIGKIDGKFDHGYLVTVNLGTATLRGVLYHPMPVSSAAPVERESFLAAGSSPRRRRRRKKGSRWSDPGHPKPNRSAYNFFFKEKHAKLKLLYPHREREFSKMIGESWNKLTEEERLVYQDCGLQDKERYRREMQEYRERLKLLRPADMPERESNAGLMSNEGGEIECDGRGCNVKEGGGSATLALL